MKKLFQSLSSSPFRSMGIFIFCAFVLWIVCFQGFLFDSFSLRSDAVSYCDHIKFYVESLGQGVYPLWDPFWQSGVPNELFLRRMGSYNPFFIVIVFLYKIGLPFANAYLVFLGLYYFLGMIGFYLLSQRVLKDKVVSFVAFLLLLFSSLGTRLFDSYILYFFIPIVWFFYFFVSFFQDYKRTPLVGFTFCLMLIFVTYIPFYFLNIFLIFSFVYVLLYSRQIKETIKQAARFISLNKILVLVCVLSACFALLPGYLFVREGSQGAVVLPSRHFTSSDANTITVGLQTITSWGMLEDILFSKAFSDLPMMQFAVLYIPLWGYILFFMCWLSPVNRKMLFLFLWMGFLFIVFSPEWPIYPFLYAHVGFFKYFRNLHFYLWIAILPILILFLCEQFKTYLNQRPSTQKARWAQFFYITLVHGLVFYFLFTQEVSVLSSFLIVGLSYFFFFLRLFQRQNISKVLIMVLLIIVALEPLDVYSFLRKNSDNVINGYLYDNVQMTSPFDFDVQYSKHVYISTFWNQKLVEMSDPFVISEYLKHRFILYDNIKFVDDDKVAIESMLDLFLFKNNLALVHTPSPESPPHPQAESQRNGTLNAEIISENSPRFNVVRFTANDLNIETNFNDRKFLVYNDNYHPGWKAFIDEKPVELFRANIAFKGMWVPAGSHQVSFKFRPPGRILLNLSLLFLFYSFLVYLFYLSIFDKRLMRKAEAHG